MSGTLKITVDCRVEGPLADGTADRALEDWSRNTTQRLGEEGVRMLRAFPMNKSGRAHGNFERTLNVVRRSPTEVRIPGVQERGVVWASWLEGTSKRNQGTKFKGYRLFRKTRAELDKIAPRIAQEELEKVLPRMGGE